MNKEVTMDNILFAVKPILEYLENEMGKHEVFGYCTSYEQAIQDATHNVSDEDKYDRFYDAGYFEAMLSIYTVIKESIAGEEE